MARLAVGGENAMVAGMSSLWKMVLALLAALTPGARGVAPFFDPALVVHGTPVNAGEAGLIARGLLVRAGEGEWVVFDQDLLRPALWFGAAAGKPPVSLATMAQASWDEPTRKAGVVLPLPAEKGVVLTPPLPGAGRTVAELLKDPRPVRGDEAGRGGLEADGRGFEGYGKAGVLHYRIGDIAVREWYQAGRGGLARYFEVGAGGELVFLLGRSGDAAPAASNHPGLKVERVDGAWIARLAASKQVRRAGLGYGKAAISSRSPAAPGGTAALWRKPVDTKIRAAAGSGPGWVLDEVGLPSANPWKRRMRPADLVFLSPERAAVVTFEGDVWQLDLSGERCRWTRIAGGLCEPLSIEQVDGVVQVFTRNGILRLRDTDGDGETDFYQNHSSLMEQTTGTRGYPLDMEVDAEGATWCSIGGVATDGRSITNRPPAGPHSGSIVRVSPDGRRIEVVGRRAREPFFGRDPATGRIVMSDQQGNWIPSSGLFPVTEGADFGYGAASVPGMALPAVWIPHDQDTSSASPLWLRGSAFEAWEGGVLHLSYGTGALFLGRPGAGWPARQGAVLPLGIRTGLPLLHARVRPGEGSVWLAGFRIYDSGAPALEGIGRLRPSGEPLAEAVDATIVREGVVLKFAGELDPASVTADAVRAKQWQYRRSAAYGSPRLKRDGKSQGTEAVATGAAFLSKDGRSVFLHIPGLAPVMQLELSHGFRVKGGKDEPRSVFLTVAGAEPADWAALGFEAPALDASVAAVRGGGAKVAASAEHGKEVAVRYGCIACHSVDGTLEGHSGPTWKGLYGADRKFLSGKQSRIADDAYLSDAILEPAKEIVEGYALGMGSYAGVLDEAELKSILLYIRSLK